MTQLLEQPRQSGKLKFTLSDFEWLSEHDFFGDKHVELLNGDIFVKGQQGYRHAQFVRQLSEKLTLALHTQAFISGQCPMVLLSPPPDFLEPDIALLRLPKSQYAGRDVSSADAHLVIEISDSTLERDQNDKLAAYARNNLPEYWIININAGRLETYQEPIGSTYQVTSLYRIGEKVSPLEFSDLELEWWS